MCLQDWRLGRFIRSVPHPLSGVGVSILLTANPQRVGLLATIAQGPAVGTDSLAIIVDSKTIFSVDANADSHFFATIATHGDLPMKAISILANMGALNVSVTEFFLPEEYLAAAMEQFKSEYGQWLNLR